MPVRIRQANRRPVKRHRRLRLPDNRLVWITYRDFDLQALAIRLRDQGYSVWIHQAYTPSAWRRAPREALDLLWAGSRFIIRPEDEPAFILGSTLYGTYAIQGVLLVIRINNRS
jgi:hypothetical protein